MLNKFIKAPAIITLSLILCGFKAEAKEPATSGKNFILPKTFKINDQFLPPLDIKPAPVKNKPVTAVKTPVKPAVATVKAETKKTTPVTSTIPAKKAPTLVNKQPDKIQIKTVKQIKPEIVVQAPVPVASDKNNIVKVNYIQANPLKTSTAVSLSNLIKNYDFSYADTIKSTITSLSEMQIVPVSYNTENGQIIAKLDSGKELYILIVPYKENSTCVRITPADGNYNLPMATINEIFTAIGNNLQST